MLAAPRNRRHPPDGHSRFAAARCRNRGLHEKLTAILGQLDCAMQHLPYIDKHVRADRHISRPRARAPSGPWCGLDSSGPRSSRHRRAGNAAGRQSPSCSRRVRGALRGCQRAARGPQIATLVPAGLSAGEAVIAALRFRRSVVMGGRRAERGALPGQDIASRPPKVAEARAAASARRTLPRRPAREIQEQAPLRSDA